MFHSLISCPLTYLIKYSLGAVCDIRRWVCEISSVTLAPHRQLIICTDRQVALSSRWTSNLPQMGSEYNNPHYEQMTSHALFEFQANLHPFSNPRGIDETTRGFLSFISRLRLGSFMRNMGRDGRGGKHTGGILSQSGRPHFWCQADQSPRACGTEYSGALQTPQPLVGEGKP